MQLTIHNHSTNKFFSKMRVVFYVESQLNSIYLYGNLVLLFQMLWSIQIFGSPLLHLVNCFAFYLQEFHHFLCILLNANERSHELLYKYYHIVAPWCPPLAPTLLTWLISILWCWSSVMTTVDPLLQDVPHVASPQQVLFSAWHSHSTSTQSYPMPL